MKVSERMRCPGAGVEVSRVSQRDAMRGAGLHLGFWKSSSEEEKSPSRSMRRLTFEFCMMVARVTGSMAWQSKV